MADGKKFSHQVFDVEMADGTEYLDVQIVHSDRVSGEMTAAKHKWGERPLYLVTFWVWHALRRTGRISTDVKFESFADSVAELEKQSDEEEDEPDPIQGEGSYV